MKVGVFSLSFFIKFPTGGPAFDYSCAPALMRVPLDKNEGSVKGIVILGGA